MPAMLLGNHSLLAIMQQWGAGPDEERAGHTLEYLYLMLAKVLLNCFTVFFALGSLSHSVMGVFFLSLCLGDVLLAGALAGTWLLSGHRATSSAAFLLTHASAVYSALPLPALVLGALDYAALARRRRRTHWTTGGGATMASRIGAVLGLWVLAGLYSAWHTDPAVFTVELAGAEPGTLALVCEVQVSRQVALSCLALLTGIGLALGCHLPDVRRWARQADRLSVETERHAPPPPGHLPISSVSMAMEEDCPQRRPPLYLSGVLLLAQHWVPYLLVVVVTSELLRLDMPAYASVNTLWAGCANSLLVGVVFWSEGSGRETGTIDGVAQLCVCDAFCDWRVCGRLSCPGNGPLPHKLPQELQAPSERKLAPLLLL